MADIQYYARSPKSLELVKGAPDYNAVEQFESPSGQTIKASLYSEDGQYFAYAIAGSVHIIDPNTGCEVRKMDIDAAEIGFSPKSSYFLTWERPKRDESSGNFNNNLKVWDMNSGELIESFLQKQQRPWSIQWTHDEKLCARLVTSGLLQVYENNNFRTPYAKLKCEGMTEFVLSPGQNYSVAVFIPVAKSSPAAVRVYQIPNFGQPMSQKTFFKADKITMKWNQLGTALLVLASTDVDHTGKSYYGETNLYLLGIAGSFDSRIELDKEGTIHGFAWSPNAREFGVVYGTMPAKTSIFDARGNVIHSFPQASRNSIYFSPHGRFVAVAGFGNLQGSMDIYDRQRQFTKMCTIEAANTVVCEWSPDGRYILTATTSPRLRVDNGVRVWHHSGKLIYAVDHDELLNVGWRPRDCEKYPLRSSLSPAPPAHKSTETVKSIKPAAPKAGAYRPPHARASGVSVATMSLHEREQAAAAAAQQNKVPGAGTPVGGRRVPGASKPVPGAKPAAPKKTDEELSKAAAKNKKKRENKKKAQEENAEGDASTDQGNNTTTSIETNGSSSQATSASSNGNGNAPTGSSPEDKKIRSLLKKLRAIEELKMRQARGDKLENTQVSKIENEGNIRQELAGLGWKD